jgi:chorismate synthase
MSATGEWFTAHVEKLEAWAKSLLKHDDPEVKAIGEDVTQTVAELKGDLDQLEHETEAAAEAVAKDAEAEAKPIVATAEQDAKTIGGQVAGDVASLAEGAATPEPAAPTASA